MASSGGFLLVIGIQDDVPEVNDEAPVPDELPVLVAVAGRVRSTVHDHQFGEGATPDQAASLGAAGLGAFVEADPEAVLQPVEQLAPACEAIALAEM